MNLRTDNIDDFIVNLADIINSYGSESYTAAEGIEYIIDNDLWRERDPSPGMLEKKTFRTFAQFCEASTPWGLNTRFETVKDLCNRNPDVLRKVTEVAKFEHGTNRFTNIDRDNVTVYDAERGNTKYYGLQRLHRERPDMYQRVIDNELSVNQAMIECGFRVKSHTVPENADAFIRKIRQVFTDREIEYIASKLASI